MKWRQLFALALAIGSAACDGFVRARVKVLTVQGEPVPDAVLRLKEGRSGNLARFTDVQGCAYFSGVVAPVHNVRVSVDKAGYVSKPMTVPTIQDNCLVVHLARQGEGSGSVDALDPAACPCDSKAGYSPTMSARFKVTTADGSAADLVGLRRADEARDPWLQVTDSSGCVGVSWIVSPDLPRVSLLLLEKDGYLPARVEVPTMEDRCYSVTIARTGSGQSSTAAAVPKNDCACAMFTGKTIWPSR